MSEAGVPQLLDEILRAAKAQGLNQQTLARRAGLSAATLSRMKTQDDASLTTLNRLAAAVGLRLTLVADDNFIADVERGTLF
jgi:transcriptional regulator with XRE-family HTH domain